jgi:oxygen-dependent protoporphyrinogen oxidase
VAVVGAGIAGLAAAQRLRRDGPADLRITVVEGSREVGGKLRTSEVGSLAVDEGAEAFLSRTPEVVALAREVGLGDDLVHPAATTASLWTSRGLRALPRTLLGIPLSAGSLRDALGSRAAARALGDFVVGGGPGDGDVAIGPLVRRRLGADVVDLLVDPLLGGVYAGRPDNLSLRATMPMLRDYRSGSLMRAASRLMPATTSPEPMFATVDGGLGRLASATLDAAKADLVLGRPVRELARDPDGRWRLVHGSTVDARTLEADAVVLALPAAPAARLLASVAPAASAELAGIDYASVALVTLAYPRAAVPASTSSGYLVPSRYARPVKAVTRASAKWGHLDTGDLVALRCSFGRHGDESDVQRDDADLVALAVAELAETLGVRGQPVATRVTRWGGALPQYAVGHLERVARIRADIARLPGLAACGAVYDGVGIPACIRSADRAVGEVLPALRQ